MELQETTSSAARKLGIPQSTLIALERRGVVGPWQRSAGGHRLLLDRDIKEVRAYLDRRNKKAA